MTLLRELVDKEMVLPCSASKLDSRLMSLASADEAGSLEAMVQAATKR